MITGIPPYTSAWPVECSVRCVCSLRYLVFTSDDETRARARAVELPATFIDAREVPSMNCACGELLDFTPGDACALVM